MKLLPPADISGVCGCAWVRYSKGYGISHTALREWFIYDPKTHPDVSWWFLFVLSLENFPGVVPANRLSPDAKYEFNLTSVHPHGYPKSISDFQGNADIELMEPIVLSFQFGGVGDNEAIAIADGAVCGIVNGLIGPDDSWARAWALCMGHSVKRHQEQLS